VSPGWIGGGDGHEAELDDAEARELERAGGVVGVVQVVAAAGPEHGGDEQPQAAHGGEQEVLILGGDDGGERAVVAEADRAAEQIGRARAAPQRAGQAHDGGAGEALGQRREHGVVGGGEDLGGAHGAR
jgi:hypothetical protein